MTNKTSMLNFTNNTILSCLSLFFLITDFYVLIPAIILHRFLILLQNLQYLQEYQLKKQKQKWKCIHNRVQKILENLRKLRKSCNHNQNINGIYNEKLHYNCIQQPLTLRLKT